MLLNDYVGKWWNLFDLNDTMKVCEPILKHCEE